MLNVIKIIREVEIRGGDTENNKTEGNTSFLEVIFDFIFHYFVVIHY